VVFEGNHRAITGRVIMPTCCWSAFRLAQVNNCFAINKEICDAEGREALLQLVEEKGRDFDAVNVATCLNRSVSVAHGFPLLGTRWIIAYRATLSKRLSRLPFREHRSVRADPRFLQLVGMAQVKLDTRPRELGPREFANILNGACGHAVSRALARLMKTPLITPPS
jgi:hypothetical protein